jgi:hypothetical protein
MTPENQVGQFKAILIAFAQGTQVDTETLRKAVQWALSQLNPQPRYGDVLPLHY